MPIDNLPTRYRELGRLKFGEDRGDRPTQLTTWRLTSDSALLIDSAAELWGGVRVDTAKGAEVVTEAEELEVAIPAQDVAGGQWWEHWTAGGLQRRCSGSALVEYDRDEPDGFRKVAPCLCDEENGPRICKPTTVLRVLLPQLPDLGVWKLVTRSVWAAAEIPPAVDFLLQRSVPAPAVLGLDSRTSKSPGGPPKHFVVPVLRTRSTLLELSGPNAGQGLQPLPFDTEGEDLEGPTARSFPAPGPPPEIPPAPAPEPPILGSDPDSGPTTPESPEPDDVAHPRRSAALEALQEYLQPVDPAAIGRDPAELVPFLEELERLAIAAEVWEPGALDAAAGRWVETPGDWRDAHGYQLHTFAQRAVLALGKEKP